MRYTRRLLDEPPEITVFQLPKLYVVISACIYLIRCYAKSVKTDLTADEKKQLQQIAAHLKGEQ